MMGLELNYALRSPDGRYYTGRVGDGWLGDKHQAFTYTFQGALRKTRLEAFREFVVERIL